MLSLNLANDKWQSSICDMFVFAIAVLQAYAHQRYDMMTVSNLSNLAHDFNTSVSLIAVILLCCRLFN